MFSIKQNNSIFFKFIQYIMLFSFLITGSLSTFAHSPSYYQKEMQSECLAPNTKLENLASNQATNILTVPNFKALISIAPVDDTPKPSAMRKGWSWLSPQNLAKTFKNIILTSFLVLCLTIVDPLAIVGFISSPHFLTDTINISFNTFNFLNTAGAAELSNIDVESLSGRTYEISEAKIGGQAYSDLAIYKHIIKTLPGIFDNAFQVKTPMYEKYNGDERDLVRITNNSPFPAQIFVTCDRRNVENGTVFDFLADFEQTGHIVEIDESTENDYSHWQQAFRKILQTGESFTIPSIMNNPEIFTTPMIFLKRDTSSFFENFNVDTQEYELEYFDPANGVPYLNFDHTFLFWDSFINNSIFLTTSKWDKYNNNPNYIAFIAKEDLDIFYYIDKRLVDLNTNPSLPEQFYQTSYILKVQEPNGYANPLITYKATFLKGQQVIIPGDNTNIPQGYEAYANSLPFFKIHSEKEIPIDYLYSAIENCKIIPLKDTNQPYLSNNSIRINIESAPSYLADSWIIQNQDQYTPDYDISSSISNSNEPYTVIIAVPETKVNSMEIHDSLYSSFMTDDRITINDGETNTFYVLFQKTMFAGEIFDSYGSENIVFIKNPDFDAIKYFTTKDDTKYNLSYYIQGVSLYSNAPITFLDSTVPEDIQGNSIIIKTDIQGKYLAPDEMMASFIPNIPVKVKVIIERRSTDQIIANTGNLPEWLQEFTKITEQAHPLKGHHITGDYYLNYDIYEKYFPAGELVKLLSAPNDFTNYTVAITPVPYSQQELPETALVKTDTTTNGYNDKSASLYSINEQIYLVIKDPATNDIINTQNITEFLTSDFKPINMEFSHISRQQLLFSWDYYDDGHMHENLNVNDPISSAFKFRNSNIGIHCLFSSQPLEEAQAKQQLIQEITNNGFRIDFSQTSYNPDSPITLNPDKTPVTTTIPFDITPPAPERSIGLVEKFLANPGTLNFVASATLRRVETTEDGFSSYKEWYGTSPLTSVITTEISPFKFYSHLTIKLTDINGEEEFLELNEFGDITDINNNVEQLAASVTAIKPEQELLTITQDSLKNGNYEGIETTKEYEKLEDKDKSSIQEDLSIIKEAFDRYAAKIDPVTDKIDNTYKHHYLPLKENIKFQLFTEGGDFALLRRDPEKIALFRRLTKKYPGDTEEIRIARTIFAIAHEVDETYFTTEDSHNIILEKDLERLKKMVQEGIDIRQLLSIPGFEFYKKLWLNKDFLKERFAVFGSAVNYQTIHEQFYEKSDKISTVIISDQAILDNKSNMVADIAYAIKNAKHNGNRMIIQTQNDDNQIWIEIALIEAGLTDKQVKDYITFSIEKYLNKIVEETRYNNGLHLDKDFSEVSVLASQDSLSRIKHSVNKIVYQDILEAITIAFSLAKNNGENNLLERAISQEGNLTYIKIPESLWKDTRMQTSKIFSYSA